MKKIYLLFTPHQKLIDCCLKIQNFIETYIYTIRYFTIGPLNFLKTAKNETNFYQTKEILRIRNLVSTLEACKNVIKYEVFANFLIRQETESFGEVKRINSSRFSLAPTEAGHTLKQCFLTCVDINICLL